MNTGVIVNLNRYFNMIYELLDDLFMIDSEVVNKSGALALYGLLLILITDMIVKVIL